MDLPVLEPGTYPWMAYLTAEQRRQVAAQITAHREYERLNQQKQATREAWLAKGGGRGVRPVLYELAHTGLSLWRSCARWARAR
jgi:hypothetical protein